MVRSMSGGWGGDRVGLDLDLDLDLGRELTLKISYFIQVSLVKEWNRNFWRGGLKGMKNRIYLRL